MPASTHQVCLVHGPGRHVLPPRGWAGQGERAHRYIKSEGPTPSPPYASSCSISFRAPVTTSITIPCKGQARILLSVLTFVCFILSLYCQLVSFPRSPLRQQQCLDRRALFLCQIFGFWRAPITQSTRAYTDATDNTRGGSSIPHSRPVRNRPQSWSLGSVQPDLQRFYWGGPRPLSAEIPGSAIVPCRQGSYFSSCRAALSPIRTKTECLQQGSPGPPAGLGDGHRQDSSNSQPCPPKNTVFLSGRCRSCRSMAPGSRLRRQTYARNTSSGATGRGGMQARMTRPTASERLATACGECRRRKQRVSQVLFYFRRNLVAGRLHFQRFGWPFADHMRGTAFSGSV